MTKINFDNKKISIFDDDRSYLYNDTEELSIFFISLMEVPFDVLRMYPEQQTVKPFTKRRSQKTEGNLDPRLFEKYKNKFLPIEAATKEIKETFDFYIKRIDVKTTDKVDSLKELISNLEESIWCVEVLREKITILEAALRAALLCLPEEKE